MFSFFLIEQPWMFEYTNMACYSGWTTRHNMSPKWHVSLSVCALAGYRLSRYTRVKLHTGPGLAPPTCDEEIMPAWTRDKLQFKGNREKLSLLLPVHHSAQWQSDIHEAPLKSKTHFWLEGGLKDISKRRMWMQQILHSAWRVSECASPCAAGAGRSLYRHFSRLH